MSITNKILELRARKPREKLNPFAPVANDNTEHGVRMRRAIAHSVAAPTPEQRRRTNELRSRLAAVPIEAANDNKPSWPLAEQLRRDRNEVLLDVAERYRAIYDAAHAEDPLIGTVADASMPIAKIYRGDSDTIKGARKVGRSHAPSLGRKASAVRGDEGAASSDGQPTFARRGAKQVLRPWPGEDLLIARIDARRDLIALQRALGALLESFEDAVLHCATLTDIGKARGIGQHAAGAGKALVMLGLEVVQAELRRLGRAV